MTHQPFTVAQLIDIAMEREEWAKSAHDKDLHGSAKEWELMAELAREFARHRNPMTDIDDKERVKIRGAALDLAVRWDKSDSTAGVLATAAGFERWMLTGEKPDDDEPYYPSAEDEDEEED